MRKRRILGVIILLFIFDLTLCTSSLQTHASETATLYIDPPETTGLALHDTFNVNLSVADVSDLTGWSVPILFLSRTINVIDVQEGPFLQSIGNTFFWLANKTNNYNATHGLIYVMSTVLGAEHGANGSGVLATMSFMVIGVGETPIWLGCARCLPSPANNTQLWNPFGFPGQLMPHTTIDGLVRVGGNDIAITDLRLQKTVTNDTNVQIDVTVRNYGNHSTTFDLTLYYDENEIETQTVTDLSPADSRNVAFTWDTTPVPKGNYTIKAYAWPVTGEMDEDNNLLIGGHIVETINGDVTGDYKVNIHDLYKFAHAFNKGVGDQEWNPNCDLNNDGIINISDIFYAARNFGKKI